MIDIYLAIPYSHSSSLVREYRFQQANTASAALIDKGYTVFSPISHGHPINLIKKLDVDWIAFDLKILNLCKMVVVVTINGWEESKGIKEELKFAQEKGKRIIYWDGIKDFIKHVK
jgi:hypothetical protein